MRIAMISEHANPVAALGEVDAGGQNLHVAELSAALVAAGHDVTVYTRRDHPEQSDLVTPQGYRVVHVPAGPARPVPKDELLPHMGEFTRFVDRAWRTDRPDVVHSHFWMSGLVAVVAARRHGIPVLHTYHALGTVKRRHQGGDDTSPPQRIGIERMIGRAAAGIIATCADEVDELARMGVPRERASVVPCGVDCTQFGPEGERAPTRLPHRVVSVGRLVPRKGFADLIAALPGVADTELVIAGGPVCARLADDPEAGRLRALAERLRVADRVRFAGQVPRDRMPALLRSADVVACVPWYEPFGIVPLEAMACGVPVVATRVGGLMDTVVEHVTGELVPPRRPAALATALRLLLADPVRRSFLGGSGRERAESRYPWQRIAAECVREYLRCADLTSTGVAAGSAAR
ncbi:glycosyltransferase [Actinophytocola algeriensis]|uniref:Glycosyltransferase involved in cell wall biosynthesis n=1 Tax=Actinophytocola algeriensis TaxID=1768010 RepID=A0A7W7Q8W9_9PSEU|nr:glycosyltransferase [Actinophytocola algeriensis]MBB4909142.1 glycosyltransferase involved in cell wall biosynthesis [Actinophytocola algeriensis]MBE1474470.1 glycosyltransferase involved in cell wall biosynthesis [Actinophytocola algeriensis]